MKATATEVQNSFGKYLKICANEDVIITRNGREIASLSRYAQDKKNKPLVCEGVAAYSSDKPFKISYQEFVRMVEDSRNQYEYINGVAYLQASPTHMHQSISSRIYTRFSIWFQNKKCQPYYSPYDVTFLINNEKNVVQPDILVICDHSKIDDKGKYYGTPSLVVEIMSPSTKTKDLTAKLELYMKGGVSEYWIVNQEVKKIDIYTFIDKEISDTLTYKINETAESVIFKGLSVNVNAVF